MFLGIAHGCAGFYRYAAADSAEESQKPKAISYVLTGGLLAACLAWLFKRGEDSKTRAYLFGWAADWSFFQNANFCRWRDQCCHWLCDDELYDDRHAIAGG